MKDNHALLMVFAKAPIPGQVKTRLIPLLGKLGAAVLHEQLAWRTLVTAVEAQICPVQLWCSPYANHSFFKACQNHFGIDIYNQKGPDLGSSMAHAFEKMLRQSRYVIIIGTDCPGLSQQDLTETLNALEEGYDAVIGPAEDGGYVLLGLRDFAPLLFENISWGTGDVLAATCECFRHLQWRWHELSTRWDVDRPEDVERLLVTENAASLVDIIGKSHER